MCVTLWAILHTPSEYPCLDPCKMADKVKTEFLRNASLTPCAAPALSPGIRALHLPLVGLTARYFGTSGRTRCQAKHYEL